MLFLLMLGFVNLPGCFGKLWVVGTVWHTKPVLNAVAKGRGKHEGAKLRGDLYVL
jgi:hypothetical protein